MSKRITKKQIQNWLGTKESWSPHGWQLDRCGYYVKDGETFNFVAFRGQDIDANVYHGTYDEIVEVTNIVKDWLNGEYGKKDAVNYIFGLQKIK